MRLLPAVLALLLPMSAYAYEISGPPADVAVLQSEVDKTPECIRPYVSQNLRKIHVAKAGKLGTLQVDGQTLHIMAYSFLRSGSIYIDTKYVRNPEVFYHEEGHWFYKAYMGQFEHAWERAAGEDFKDLSSAEKHDNAYLKDPQEEFAEIFAYRLLGEKFFKYNAYDADLFPRSSALLAQIMDGICK